MSKARPQNEALAKARASRKDATPENYYSGQARMKIPKELAGEWSDQSSAEKGAVWVDGLAARRSTLLWLKAIEHLCPIGSPSWIVGAGEVTVIWSDWSATAPTQVQAIVMMLEQIFPDGDPPREGEQTEDSE